MIMIMIMIRMTTVILLQTVRRGEDPTAAYDRSPANRKVVLLKLHLKFFILQVVFSFIENQDLPDTVR